MLINCQARNVFIILLIFKWVSYLDLITKEINNSWVILICIKNPGDVVYWGRNAYASSGTTIKIMEPEEILELRLKLPGLTDFTRQEVPSEYNDDLVRIFADHVEKAGHPLETGPNLGCPKRYETFPSFWL